MWTFQHDTRININRKNEKLRLWEEKGSWDRNYEMPCPVKRNINAGFSGWVVL
jgi:hypothetical protein